MVRRHIMCIAVYSMVVRQYIIQQSAGGSYTISEYLLLNDGKFELFFITGPVPLMFWVSFQHVCGFIWF